MRFSENRRRTFYFSHVCVLQRHRQKGLQPDLHLSDQRKTLSVDFAVPSLLRYYLALFIKRPLNGDCLSSNGCYTVRANLLMRCVPLQKTIAGLLDVKLAAMNVNRSSTGQLPYRQKRPVPKVLNLGLTSASRKSNQVVVEVGEEMVKTGCGGLHVYEDAPVVFLEMDLTGFWNGGWGRMEAGSGSESCPSGKFKFRGKRTSTLLPSELQTLASSYT